jgi:exodeoxyribonuclease VII large subunit
MAMVTVEPITKSLSVSEYILQLNRSLSTQRGCIKGEVISVKVVGSAAYYTIKDKTQEAKLDCTTWMNVYRANGIDLKVGDEIVVTGAPEVYAPYGKFSFRANAIEYAGEGDLKRAFDKLKAKLEAEGLLDKARKRPMPVLSKKIGIITSMSSGVVIHDFISNLDRHGYKIITCDSKVEGKEAVLDILAAIRTMSKQDIEVLVIIRGGGAIESFQAFNTESVIRAVAGFKVPVVTGIGHDVDITLTQLVADIGVSTPTAVAAEFNSQWEGLRNKIDAAETSTLGRFKNILQEKARSIDNISDDVLRSYGKQMNAALKIVNDASLRVTYLFSNLSERVRTANSGLQSALGILKTTLRMKSTYLNKIPLKLVDAVKTDIISVQRDLTLASRTIRRSQTQSIKSADKRLKGCINMVSTHDPERNLRLGYSLSYVNGKLVRQLSDVDTGDTLTTRLLDGSLISEVKELK